MVFAGKLGNIGLALSPVMLTIVIGAMGRTYQDDFAPREYGPVQHQRILAYKEPVRWFEQLEAAQELDSYPVHVREIASRWIRLHQAGELRTLTANSITDRSLDGIKANILRANRRLGDALFKSAVREAKKNSIDQAIKDLVLVLHLSRISRHFDVYALHALNKLETDALTLLEKLLPRLTIAQREFLKKEFAKINPRQEELKRMFHLAQKFLGQDTPVKLPQEAKREEVTMGDAVARASVIKTAPLTPNQYIDSVTYAVTQGSIELAVEAELESRAALKRVLQKLTQ